MRPTLGGDDHDKTQRRIVAAFSQAAPRYDRHAHLQRRVARDLATRLAALSRPTGGAILEVGCGTGLVARSLIALHPPWLPEVRWVLTDIAPPMLTQAAQRLVDCPTALSFVACDVDRLPFSGGCFGLIYASLVLQWVADLPATLGRLAALLAPGGRILITVLAMGSFAEWHAARHAHGLASTLPAYLDPADLSAAWPVRFRLLADQNYRRHYADGLAFLRELRGLGATIPPAGYTSSSSGALRALLRDLPNPFTVTYRVISLCYHRD